MLYQISDGTVSLGGQTVLNHIDFEIKGEEKTAIVGKNGAGKTTLLRLIAGEIPLDRDDRRQTPGVTSSRKFTVGMLRQNAPVRGDRTVFDMLMESCPAADPYSKERYLYEMEFDRLFTGFGFAMTDKNRLFASFSGGEQTKISMIGLFLQKPDLLLLDEPTNHLDIPTVEWLEEYLRNYHGAVIFVSHDRFFLDQTVNIVYELENGKLCRYSGNYTAYREQKRKNLEIRQKAWERQQAEEKRLLDLVEKFKTKPNKAAFARSRLSMLRRMERVEKPGEDDAHIFTGSLEPAVTGPKWVIEAEHLKAGYEKPLLELSLRVQRGRKIAIIGDNGVGKTTLLKTIAGFLPPLEGSLTLGNNTLMGYFDQQTALIGSEKTVAEHFLAHFPVMTDKEARQTLGAWLFGGKEASKKINMLSGGEKSRLFLCELMTTRPNLLLLDEPTNHMDIAARETLESALRAYTGTILFVSHDRYFADRVADAVLVIRDQSAFYYPFGYRHYLEHCRKTGNEDISAMVTAENEALVADMRAVPKGERRRLREISTEEAYLDWKLGLAAKPLEEAQTRWESLRQQYENELLPEELEAGLQEAWEAWHGECLKWYDLFLELGL